MFTYEYRGYNGVKPKKPDPINAIICRLLYQVALQHFTSIIEPMIKDIYESYLDIQKYALLPDLSFAAVLRDGTVMVEVDKE